MRGTIPHIQGSGVFMIQPKDIDEFGRVNWWQVTETELGGRAGPRWLEVGDVIFRMNGKTNLATYIDKIDVPGQVVCSHQFFHIRVDEPELDPAFLAWYINLPSTQSALKACATGSGKTVVPLSLLKELDISWPQRSVQDEVLNQWHQFVSRQRLLLTEIKASSHEYDNHITRWLTSDMASF